MYLYCSFRSPAFRFFRTYVDLDTHNFAVKCSTYLPTYLPSAASGRKTYLPTSKVTAFYYLFFGLRPKTYLPTSALRGLRPQNLPTYLPTYTCPDLRRSGKNGTLCASTLDIKENRELPAGIEKY